MLPGEDIFLERYARFLEVAFGKSQADLFELVKSYYPDKTQFVVMPMDMDYMGAGHSPVSIAEQHDELAKLKADSLKPSLYWRATSTVVPLTILEI